MADKAERDALQEDVRQDDNLKDSLTVMWRIVGFAIAFPNGVWHRERLRLLLRQFDADIPAFPKLYPATEERPCIDCEVPLSVGPHLARSGVPIVCPLCGIRRLERPY